MDDDELLRYAKMRYPNIAFRHGDKPKSFIFNVIYTLIWVILVFAVSGAGYLFVNPYCGLGAILSLPIMKGLLDVFMGNTVLVNVGKQGSLVIRKTKERTKKDYLFQMRLSKKLSALDKDEMEQKLVSLISEVLSDDEDNNQEKAFAIASSLNMDKNKGGQLSEAEMLDTTYHDLLSSFGIEEDQGTMKDFEEFANEILQFLNSNPNVTSKEIIDKFSNGTSKEDKYDPFS